MDKIKDKIDHRIKQINAIIPNQLGAYDLTYAQLKTALKQYRKQNIQARIRNFFIILFLLALTALILGKESYYYLGGAGLILSYIILSPSARYVRILTLSKQKLFLLELLSQLDTTVVMPALKPHSDVMFDEELDLDAD